MYNKTIIEFGFCDIRNNQGRGKCNQPRLIALTEIIPDITTTERTLQAAASLETIQVLALFSQRYITHAHCARYNLQI